MKSKETRLRLVVLGIIVGISIFGWVGPPAISGGCGSGAALARDGGEDPPPPPPPPVNCSWGEIKACQLYPQECPCW